MGFQNGFRINTNTSAVNTYRSYTSAQAGLEKNIERLSSGLRINKAADDSAGLAISQRMNNQIRGMQQANRNVQQANNMMQTAEGGLNEIHNILGRMRELAVQSASDGVNGDDRASIDLEFQQLKAEITRIGDGTEYNNMKLINGDRAKGLTLDASGNLDTAHNAAIQDNGLAADSVKVSSSTANGEYKFVATSDDTIKLTDADNNELDSSLYRPNYPGQFSGKTGGRYYSKANLEGDLDWKEEIRLSLEERTSFSPDALTGLEANLRFPGKETCETKIFGRLSAWQNWIFNRPNAVSEEGALKLFGTGTRAKFDNKRV